MSMDKGVIMQLLTNKEYTRLMNVDADMKAIDAVGLDGTDAWNEIEWPKHKVTELEVEQTTICIYSILYSFLCHLIFNDIVDRNIDSKTVVTEYYKGRK